jgi:short-subunit dehydrogenase
MPHKKYNSTSWISEKLELRNSDVHGQGVFTKEDIIKGEIVIIWGGEVVSAEDFFKGTGQKHTNVGIEENLFLVAPNTAEKTIDDFMNHSCDANLWLDDEVTLSAKRDIEAGEELFIDYAIEVGDEDYIMKNPCYCTAENCRKLITGKDWKLKKVQGLYKNHFSPFINKRIKKQNQMNILITGGSRGIGKAIAKELNSNGHNLMLVARNSSNLDKTKGELMESNKNVDSFVCEVGSEEEIDKLVSYCSERDFQPNVLILSAGIFIEGSLTNSNSKDFYETMNVDLYHIYHTVKKFISILKKQENAKIIIIGSTASLEAYPIGALYGVAKWGLKGYSINLRKELMNDNIGVTLINPGGTLTDLWEGEELAPNRLLEPSDIGKLISTILTLSPQAVVEELIVRPMLGDFHE